MDSDSKADASISMKTFGPALIVGFIVFSICALAVPSLEAPLNDEWCYAYISRVFAQTGRLTFAGCSAATLGIQILSGALVIKLFGLSFHALRMLIAALTGACATVQYLLMRQVHIPGRNAAFGTLAVMLSPVVFPNSIMFMTDVPGLLLMLLAILLSMMSFAASSRTKMLSLMIASFAVSLCAASIRQFFFLLPISLFGAIAYIRRRDRLMCFAGSVMSVASIVCLVLTLHWYSSQANTAGSAGSVAISLTALSHPLRLSKACVRMALTVAMYLMPITVAFLLPLRRKFKVIAVGLVLGGVIAAIRPLPELGNMVTPYGYTFSGQMFIGDKPVVLGLGLRVLITLITMAGGCCALWVLLRNARLIRKYAMRSEVLFCLCVGPFVTMYALAVATRYPWGIFDRYLIPIISIIAVVLLNVYRRRIPVGSWILAILFLGFEWAAVHDYTAEYSARMQVVEQLLHAGVPQDAITAGMERDQWTQLEEAGAVKYVEPHPHPFPAAPWLFAAPVIRPQYFVTRSALKGFTRINDPVCFGQILPPFRGCVYAVR